MDDSVGLVSHSDGGGKTRGVVNEDFLRIDLSIRHGETRHDDVRRYLVGVSKNGGECGAGFNLLRKLVGMTIRLVPSEMATTARASHILYHPTSGPEHREAGERGRNELADGRVEEAAVSLPLQLRPTPCGTQLVSNGQSRFAREPLASVRRGRHTVVADDERAVVDESAMETGALLGEQRRGAHAAVSICLAAESAAMISAPTASATGGGKALFPTRR